MKSKLKLLLLLIGIVSVSCNEEDLLDSGKENSTTGVVVLQERDPNSPLILSKDIGEKKNIQFKELLPFDQYLGRSYKLGNIDYSSSLDLGFPVIDLSKLSSDYPDFILQYGLNTTSSTVFSYSNFDRYTSNSKKTKTVSGGLSLNLGLFKLGAKKTMKEVFTESKISETNRVFGELNVLYQKGRYRMLSDSDFIDKLSVSYLSNSFKELLYNRTPSQLFEIYGGFVLTDFVTGGKAQALYTGVYTGTEDSETKEKAMNTSINASYANSGADFGIGRDYFDSQSASNKVTEFELSVRTVGGVGPITNFGSPNGVESYNVNLSSWGSSLSNESTHSVIGISENGVVPLSDLILETNLKKRMKSFYSNGVTENRTFQEPRLEMRLSDEIARGICVVTLHGRYGTPVILDLFTELNDEYKFSFDSGEPDLEERLNFLNTLKDKYAGIYNVKMIGELDFKDPYGRRDVSSFISSGRHFDEIVGFVSSLTVGFDHTKLKKFVYNGITYLLSSENGRKVGYTIYDDYIFDTYGMRAFVDSLPFTTVDPRNLRDYILVAL